MEEWESVSYEEIAAASVAGFELEIREYQGFPDLYRLFLLFRLPPHQAISLEWTLPDFEALKQAQSLLQTGHAGKRSPEIVVLGRCFGRNLTLAQDDDWPERFYLMIRDAEFPMGDVLCFTIAREQSQNFARGLEILLQQIEEM